MTISFPEFVPEPSEGRFRALGTRSVRRRRGGIYRNALKRAFDVAAVLVAAPVVAPVILALALAVRHDGGPAFYTQTRVGRDGVPFRMWKLRSMVVDADARMAAHLAADPAARREWQATQKLKDDPRITPLGRLLRATSLDELPQLWNVLKGDMSLVGPRPMMVAQQAIYPGSAYYLLRPGLTGHWQTAGRNATTFAERAGYDAVYEARLTLWEDLRILTRTVSVVLKGTGY